VAMSSGNGSSNGGEGSGGWSGTAGVNGASTPSNKLANTTLSAARRPPVAQQVPEPILDTILNDDLEEEHGDQQLYQDELQTNDVADEEQNVDYEGVYEDEDQVEVDGGEEGRGQDETPPFYQGVGLDGEAGGDILGGLKYDPILAPVNDDPRDGKRIKKKGKGRNTESFDPQSTLVRPDMRIIVGPNTETYGSLLKHDDVVIVPDFFCGRDDWSLYYKLIEEMRESQAHGDKDAEWISWHEGAHLISKNPNGSQTYQEIQAKISAYFNIPTASVGTRFNWYRTSTDWKPFHHDSAAYNTQRAQNQNITVGVSFGATRELAFLNVKNGSKIYFPQVLHTTTTTMSCTRTLLDDSLTPLSVCLCRRMECCSPLDEM
jgi:hypothetical protein